MEILEQTAWSANAGRIIQSGWMIYNVKYDANSNIRMAMMQNIIKRGLLGVVIGIIVLVAHGVLSEGDVVEFINGLQGFNFVDDWLPVLFLLFVLFGVGLLNGLVKAPKLFLAIGIVFMPCGFNVLWLLAMLGPLNGYSPEFGWYLLIVTAVISVSPTVFWYWLPWLSKKKPEKVSDNF